VSLEKMGDSLSGWVPRGLAAGDPLVAIRSAWGEIVGADTARAAQPVAIEGDTLIVLTNSSAWSHQLSFLTLEIIRSLRSLPAGRNLARLRFRVGVRKAGPKAAPMKSRNTPARPPRGSAGAPPASPEEALARFRARVENQRRVLLEAGWTACEVCGAATSEAKRCAPCAGKDAQARGAATERLMFDAPWLGFNGTAALVGGLALDEYEIIRKRMLSRWWDVLVRARARKVVSLDRREASIASSYLLLQTGWEPDRITPAVARNLLGDEIFALVFGEKQSS
jgi:hypothetical protein